jgi:hypothetical protein
MTFTPFSYTQQIDTGQELYYPTAGLQAHYKNLPFTKESTHQLYYLSEVPGKQLPVDLQGRFTNLRLLQAAVDRYLKEHPEGLPDYVPLKEKRLHRSKEYIDGRKEKLLDDETAIEDNG